MVTVGRFASAAIANLPPQQETGPNNAAYPTIKEHPLQTELVWSIVRTAARKSRKPFYQEGTFSAQTNEARATILCVILVGTGKVLLHWVRWIGWNMDLTRPKWLKNRKKMASKMGKKSGRVR